MRAGGSCDPWPLPWNGLPNFMRCAHEPDLTSCSSCVRVPTYNAVRQGLHEGAHEVCLPQDPFH